MSGDEWSVELGSEDTRKAIRRRHGSHPGGGFPFPPRHPDAAT